MALPDLSVLPLVVPDLIQAGVGDTQAAVRQHFERAQRMQPSIVTLDDANELFANMAHAHTIADLLTELTYLLDRYCSEQLLFVAACRSPNKLPEALSCRLHMIPLE